MSLNNIEIPDIVITELYRDNLLESTVKTPAINQRPTTTTQPATTPQSATASPSTTTGHPPTAQSISPETIPSSRPTATMPSGSTAQPIASPAATAPATPLPSEASRQPAPTAQAAHTPATPAPTSTSPSPAAGTASSGPIYKSLGNNRKQITIIVQSPGIAFLPDDQLAVLTKMLEACRMNMGDVAIVNHASEPVVIQALRQQLKPSIILLFGIQPVDIRLPINFPIFKIQGYDDCTYLYSPSLAELLPPTEESKLLKSKLWVCLKTLFGI